LLLSAQAQTVLVKPYVQPGDGAGLGVADVKVIAWMTDDVPGKFTVEYSVAGSPMKTAEPAATRVEISEQQRYLTYATKLDGLPLNSEVHYRVRHGATLVGASSFHTRKAPGNPIRFVVTGDVAAGTPAQLAIANQLALKKPEFVLVCGDIAYNRGRVSEYLKHFWPVYGNGVGTDSSAAIAPLMQSVPFYVTLGNHDVELADLRKNPDAFAAFYFFHPPRNAPATGSWRPFIPGTDEQVRKFQAATENAGYPYLCLYSFDDGDAHFLVLDSTAFMPVLSADYREWIRRDLMESKSRWKFVLFHHPGFNSSANHRNQQKMRLLSPLFEEAGVTIVFSGHVHNYQRSKPLRFEPKDVIPEVPALSVRGQFQLDDQFDGIQRTEPNGVIYIVTGGGGAKLYPMEAKENSGVVPADPDSPGSFTAASNGDRHSFTLVELDQAKLLLRQLDANGDEIDRITITKGK